MSEKSLNVYRSIDELNENQWNNVVKQSGRGSVFHRAGWLRAVEQGIGLPARHLVLEKNGSPLGLLPNFLVDIDLPSGVPAPFDQLEPKRLVSLTPGFGGPLFVGDERERFELLFGNVGRVFPDGIVYHRVKTVDNDFMRYGSRFARHGYDPETTTCRFTLDLEKGWEKIEENMARSKRAHLSEARENEATVEDRELTRDAMREFYETYRKAMDRVGGTAYPFEFFDLLREELEDRIKLLTVAVDGEMAGGRLYLLDKERSVLRSFFQGLDSDYFGYQPSELLEEYAIKWGIERGYETYDLGSTSPDFDDGAFKYKDEIGASPSPIVAWERGTSRIQWPAYRLGRRLMRRRVEFSEAVPLPTSWTR